MTSVKSMPGNVLKSIGMSVDDILHDYKVAFASRQASLDRSKGGFSRQGEIWNFWRWERSCPVSDGKGF
jgi:hypothetical protein